MLVLGVFGPVGLESCLHFPLHELWQGAFEAKLSELAPVEAALVASVKPEVTALVEALLDRCQIDYRLLKVVDLSIEVCSGRPEEIGADLLANAYAAWRHYPGHSIVIDIGTATTFQAVHKDLKFLGGAIYPGLAMASRALHEQTALLPLVTVEKPAVSCSVDTTTAIRSGIYYGLLGAAERIIREWRHSLFAEEPVNVLITGGISRSPLGKQIQEDLAPLVTALNPDLTLLGLGEILREQLCTNEHIT